MKIYITKRTGPDRNIVCRVEEKVTVAMNKLDANKEIKYILSLSKDSNKLDCQVDLSSNRNQNRRLRFFQCFYSIENLRFKIFFLKIV